MSEDVWTDLENQRDSVIDRPPTNLADLSAGTLDDEYFTRLFDESSREDPNVPLSYHTKACAWASDYPFVYRRVMVYLNPGSGHLADYSLEPYVKREFGCTLATFKRLVADEWFVVLLDRPGHYDPSSRRTVADTFDEIRDVNPAVGPRYVHLVDVALGAAIAEHGGSDRVNYVRKSTSTTGTDYVDIDETVDAAQRRDPWSELPTAEFDYYGVTHSIREYVTERALKLQLAADALPEEDGFQRIAASIQDQSASYSSQNRPDLIGSVYSSWNQIGTPIFYCDSSGYTDIGPDPAREYADNVTDRWSLKQGLVRSARKLRAVVFDEIPSTEIYFKSPNDVTPADVFAHPPDEPLDRRQLERRVQEHERYYNAVRAELMTKRENFDSREEIIKRHNLSAESDYGVTEVGGSTGTVLEWAEGLADPLSVIDPTPVTGAVSMGASIVSYWQRQRAVDFKVPRPEQIHESALGRIHSWRINYGPDDAANDQESSGTDPGPGYYVSEWEAVD